MIGTPELRRYAEDTLGVPARLHDYQWEGVAFLYRNHGALLADEMGLGKTVQTAVALSLTLSARKEISRALIVAPCFADHELDVRISNLGSVASGSSRNRQCA